MKLTWDTCIYITCALNVIKEEHGIQQKFRQRGQYNCKEYARFAKFAKFANYKTVKSNLCI